ncbi:unnamed protein product [Aphanomyces euteiches]
MAHFAIVIMRGTIKALSSQQSDFVKATLVVPLPAKSAPLNALLLHVPGRAFVSYRTPINNGEKSDVSALHHHLDVSLSSFQHVHESERDLSHSRGGEKHETFHRRGDEGEDSSSVKVHSKHGRYGESEDRSHSSKSKRGHRDIDDEDEETSHPSHFHTRGDEFHKMKEHRKGSKEEGGEDDPSEMSGRHQRGYHLTSAKHHDEDDQDEDTVPSKYGHDEEKKPHFASKRHRGGDENEDELEPAKHGHRGVKKHHMTHKQHRQREVDEDAPDHDDEHEGDDDTDHNVGSSSSSTTDTFDEIPSMTITLHGSSERVLSSVVAEILPWHSGAMALNVSINASLSHIPGSLLVDIDWPFANSLSYVATTAETVVDESALANRTTSRVILAAHDSMLYLSLERNLNIHSLTIESIGTGFVQVETPALNVSRGIELKAAGTTSTVALAAKKVTAELLRATAVYEGSIYVASHDIAVGTVASTMVGEGVISYYDRAACDYHDVSMLGGGEVHAGAFKCDDTSIYSVGPGHVVIDGGRSLHATHIGIGKLSYIEKLPDVVTHIGFAPRFGVHELTSQVPKWSLLELPPHEPRDVHLISTMVLPLPS